MAQRRMRQLKSIEVMKRLEDQRLEISAQRYNGLYQQLVAIDAEIEHLEEDVALQLETASIESAPYLTTFIRSASSEVQRLKAKKLQVAREASEQEHVLRALFKKVRVLEMAKERNLKRVKQSVEAAEAAHMLEDLLRHQARHQ